MSQIVVHDKLFIGGAWVEPAGDQVIEVVSPVTEQVVARVPHAMAADVDKAVAAAREAFDHGPWPRMTPAERIEVVTRIKDGFLARRQEMAELITLQNGSPIDYSLRAQTMGPVAVLAASLAAAATTVW
ncbi:aldehyde dehydrogenase family protein, partial [Streptomyces albipurpureus]